jgi:hypothetical protein
MSETARFWTITLILLFRGLGKISRSGGPLPRRSILSSLERTSLLALPDSNDELIRHYSFTEADLSLIRQRGV